MPCVASTDGEMGKRWVYSEDSRQSVAPIICSAIRSVELASGKTDFESGHGVTPDLHGTRKSGELGGAVVAARADQGPALVPVDRADRRRNREQPLGASHRQVDVELLARARRAP